MIFFTYECSFLRRIYWCALSCASHGLPSNSQYHRAQIGTGQLLLEGRCKPCVTLHLRISKSQGFLSPVKLHLPGRLCPDCLNSRKTVNKCTGVLHTEILLTKSFETWWKDLGTLNKQSIWPLFALDPKRQTCFYMPEFLRMSIEYVPFQKFRART